MNMGRSVGEIIHWKERKMILRLHLKNFNKSYYLISVHLQGRAGLLNIRSNWSRLINFPENGSKDFPDSIAWKCLTKRARNIHCGFPRRISRSFKISENALSIKKKIYTENFVEILREGRKCHNSSLKISGSEFHFFSFDVISSVGPK